MLKQQNRILALETLKERTVLSAQGFPLAELVVFGDILSDTGNTILGSGGAFRHHHPISKGAFPMARSGSKHWRKI